MAVAASTTARTDDGTQYGSGRASLLSRVRHHVQTRPDAMAVRDDGGRQLTYRQLWDRAATIAEVFRTCGAEAGQVVAFVLPNRAEYQAAFVGALRAGLVPATIPTTTSTDVLTQMVTVAGARLLVGARTVHGRDGVDPLGSVAAASPWQCEAIVLEHDGSFVARGVEQGVVPQPAERELAHLMFTSSTTGVPKAVMHTEQTLAALNAGFADRFDLGPATPIFMPSPLGHSVGGIHGIRLALYLGTELVLQDRWDPQRALHLVEETQARFTAAATPFLRDLVASPTPPSGVKLGGLTTFLCGGAQVPPELLSRCRTEFPDTFVTVLWGMTEGGVTTCVPGDPPARIRDTAGCGLPGLQLQVLDPTGTPQPPGVEGELSMRGPGVFVGYLGQPDLYDASTTADGYFRTGDLAVLDEDGYVRITGRSKDLIVRGGVNLSPVPTENALAAHPDIVDVAVIGAPEDRLGERICAVVQAPRDFSLADAIAWCDQQGLPKRQWPEQLVVVTEFPRTAAGKIRKVQLRDALFAPQDDRGSHA